MSAAAGERAANEVSGSRSVLEAVMPIRRALRSLACLVLLVAAPAGVAAQSQTGPSGSAPEAAIPPRPQLEILIKSTLAAFNHANVTGEYAVLHKLGAPEFQRDVSVQRLFDAFKEFRSKNIEIGFILLHSPALNEDPKIGSNGWLRLAGRFDTRPNRVNFRLQFRNHENHWQLVDIWVHVIPVAEDNK